MRPLPLLTTVLLLASGAAHAQSPAVKAAIADPARPAEDRALDAQRKPAEVLAFEGVKPGDKVIERFPGNAYFTRLLAKTVGPKGHVYIAAFRKADGSVLDDDKAQAAVAAFPNVSIVASPMALPQASEPVDVVISLQNYHDLHVGAQAGVAATENNAAAFKALKPGGTFIVIDHIAPDGAGVTVAPKTHRIEPSTARAEVEKAGFVFAGSSEALRNPADPHTATVSDPSIAGKTDRFMFKFRKPK